MTNTSFAERMEGYSSLFNLMQDSEPVDNNEWKAICNDVAGLIRSEIDHLSETDWNGLKNCMNLANNFVRLSRKVRTEGQA